MVGGIEQIIGDSKIDVAYGELFEILGEFWPLNANQVKLNHVIDNGFEFQQYGRQLIEAPFKSVGWTVKDDLNEK